MGQMKGKASIEFEHPPVIISAGSVVGKKEGEGPLGSLFDEIELDDMFGMDNWEQAESTMQKKTADLVIEKGGIRKGDLRYLFAGDLLGQLIATSFGTVDLEIPLLGFTGPAPPWGRHWDWVQWRSTRDMRTRSCPWRPAILPPRKSSFVFHWPMGTRGRPLPHGLLQAAAPWFWPETGRMVWPASQASQPDAWWTWAPRIL